MQKAQHDSAGLPLLARAFFSWPGHRVPVSNAVSGSGPRTARKKQARCATGFFDLAAPYFILSTVNKKVLALGVEGWVQC